MDDVIEGNRRLKCSAIPCQLVDQPRPYQKDPPKRLGKTLQNIHLDEVEKIVTRGSTRQDGGGVYNLDPSNVDNMYFSYECKLNLSTT